MTPLIDATVTRVIKVSTGDVIQRGRVLALSTFVCDNMPLHLMLVLLEDGTMAEWDPANPKFPVTVDMSTIPAQRVCE